MPSRYLATPSSAVSTNTVTGTLCRCPGGGGHAAAAAAQLCTQLLRGPAALQLEAAAVPCSPLRPRRKVTAVGGSLMGRQRRGSGCSWR